MGICVVLHTASSKHIHVDVGSNARIARTISTAHRNACHARWQTDGTHHCMATPPAIRLSVMTQLQNIRPDPLLRITPRPSESPSPLTVTQAQAPPSSACYPTRAHNQRKTIRATTVLPDLERHTLSYDHSIERNTSTVPRSFHHTHTAICFRKLT